MLVLLLLLLLLLLLFLDKVVFSSCSVLLFMASIAEPPLPRSLVRLRGVGVEPRRPEERPDERMPL